MRVDEPMLSMVATRNNADNRSGAKVPRARHAPFELVDAGDQTEHNGSDLDTGRPDHRFASYAILPPVSTHFPVAAWSGEVQRPQPRAGRFTSTIPTATSSTASTSCRPTGSASQAEPISNAKTGVRNTNTEMRVAG